MDSWVETVSEWGVDSVTHRPLAISKNPLHPLHPIHAILVWKFMQHMQHMQRTFYLWGEVSGSLVAELA